MSTPEVLAFQNVRMHFPGVALYAGGLSFSIRRGSWWAVYGPDGAGKTTLMRLAVGELVPSEGNVRLFGADPRERQHVGRFGYLPQEYAQYEDLTVRETLAFVGKLQGMDEAVWSARMADLLGRVGLAGFQDRRVAHLSGGMRKKLALVTHLLYAPEFLLLDEPTLGVDPLSRAEIWSFLHEIQARKPLTVVFATVYAEEAERADRVLILDPEGPPEILDPAELNHHRVVWFPSPSLGGKVVDRQGNGAHVLLPISELPEDLPPEWVRGATLDDWVLAHTGGLVLTEPVAGSPERGPATVTIEGVVRRFGEFVAVDGVRLSLHAGEITALLGPNGAGKTTLIRMMVGLLPRSEGKIRVMGRDPEMEGPRVRAFVGYMPQILSLYHELRVGEVLEIFGAFYGLSGSTLRHRLAKLREAFSLDRFWFQAIQDLPRGVKQRVGLSLALLSDPPILLLDEPTSGVSSRMRRVFWSVLRDLARQGKTILVTTHDLREAEEADRVVALYRGRVIADGAPQLLKREPPCRVLRFAGEAPSLPPGTVLLPRGRWVDVVGPPEALADLSGGEPVEPELEHLFVCWILRYEALKTTAHRA